MDRFLKKARSSAFRAYSTQVDVFMEIKQPPRVRIFSQSRNELEVQMGCFAFGLVQFYRSGSPVAGMAAGW